MKRFFISLGFVLTFLLAAGSCKMSSPDVSPAVEVMDGGRFGAIPTGRAGGVLTGFYPNPGLDAAAISGFDAAGLAVSNLAPGTAAQVLMSNATPTAAWETISQDCTVGATGVLTCTQLQAGAVTAGNQGQVSCGSATTTCGFTQASTSSGAGSGVLVQAQGTTAASQTGGDLTLKSGSATGATAGTPGNIHLDRRIPTGSSTTEGTIFFDRSGTPDFAFRNYAGASTYVAAYMGSTAVGAIGNGNFLFLRDQASTFTSVNDATTLQLTIGNTVEVTLTASLTQINATNWAIGTSGSGGTAAINGPARTTTQLIAQTGATLNAGQHYFFLPVNINGQAMQLVMCQ